MNPDDEKITPGSIYLPRSATNHKAFLYIGDGAWLIGTPNGTSLYTGHYESKKALLGELIEP